MSKEKHALFVQALSQPKFCLEMGRRGITPLENALMVLPYQLRVAMSLNASPWLHVGIRPQGPSRLAVIKVRVMDE
jgi:hypothetical protein